MSFETLDDRSVLSAIAVTADAPNADAPALIDSLVDHSIAPHAAPLVANEPAQVDPPAFPLSLFNVPPQGTDITVIMTGLSFTFSPANFGFSDPGNVPPDNFLAVEITTLPALGQMMFQGSGVAKGQFISVAALQNGFLTFTTSGVENTSFTSFTFQVQDDGGTLNGGVDTDPTPNTFTFIFDNARAGFVNGLYNDVLLRQPDTPGLINWLNQLDFGATNRTVATDIWETPEHRGIQVDGFYNQFLHRAADPAGRQTWINLMLGGMTEEQVELAFMNTPEFLQLNPLIDAFVIALYQDLLNRAPDPAGQLFWTTAIGNGQLTPSQVAAGLLNSTERHQLFVSSLYPPFLNRFPDSFGLAFWTNQMDQGLLGEEGVAIGLLSSIEYGLLH